MAKKISEMEELKIKELAALKTQNSSELDFQKLKFEKELSELSVKIESKDLLLTEKTSAIEEFQGQIQLLKADKAEFKKLHE